MSSTGNTLESICAAQGCEKAGINRCSACGVIKYCSKECQKAGWKAGHKTECATLTSAAKSTIKKANASPVLDSPAKATVSKLHKARANNSNIIIEENFYLLQWVYRIRRVSCARGLRVGFLRPDFLWSIYRPMMRSEKLWRTDGDIFKAVGLWYSVKRAAAEKRYGHISEWDVSSVTDMHRLFVGMIEFNDDISQWDVSNVTDMNMMFFGARAFNQPIGCWDVSKVTSMGSMFYNAFAFNQPIGDWDVSSATNFSGMFSGAQSFNQPIGNWNTSNVTNTFCMFCCAQSFNQPVGDWNVSKVTDMSKMFVGACSFNQDLTRWDMQSVKVADGVFRNASAMQSDNKPIRLR
jgi:surface protein